MRICLIHIDEASHEAVVLVPGGAEKTAIMVPIDALPAFLPILHDATEGLGEQRCETCAAPRLGL